MNGMPRSYTRGRHSPLATRPSAPALRHDDRKIPERLPTVPQHHRARGVLFEGAKWEPRQVHMKDTDILLMRASGRPLAVQGAAEGSPGCVCTARHAQNPFHVDNDARRFRQCPPVTRGSARIRRGSTDTGETFGPRYQRGRGLGRAWRCKQLEVIPLRPPAPQGAAQRPA